MPSHGKHEYDHYVIVDLIEDSVLCVDAARPHALQVSRQQFWLASTGARVLLQLVQKLLDFAFGGVVTVLLPPNSVGLCIRGELQFHTSSAFTVTHSPLRKASRPRFTLATISGS